MRQPSFSRAHKRRRQQRLLRTAVGFVVFLALLSLMVGKCTGKGKKSEGTPKVAFVAAPAPRAESTGKAGKAAPEADSIIEMLDGWYQRAFIDPKQFGEGTFSEVADNFAKDARASFSKDLTTLTIGEAREEVERVEPKRSTVAITVFFDDGKATFAVADVKFEARARLKEKRALPLAIKQALTLHLEKLDGDWRVVYYTGKQTQDSIVPASPSPVAS